MRCTRAVSLLATMDFCAVLGVLGVLCAWNQSSRSLSIDASVSFSPSSCPLLEGRLPTEDLPVCPVCPVRLCSEASMAASLCLRLSSSFLAAAAASASASAASRRLFSVLGCTRLLACSSRASMASPLSGSGPYLDLERVRCLSGVGVAEGVLDSRRAKRRSCSAL